EDGGGDRRRLQETVKRDRSRVAEPQALVELRQDPADRRLVARAEDHAELSALPDEDAPGYGLALDRGAEGDGALPVDRRGAEAGKRAAGRRGIALGNDLLELASRGEQQGFGALPSPPHRCQEGDVAPRVDRGRVETRHRSGRDARRRGAAQRHRADPSTLRREDTFDRAPAAVVSVPTASSPDSAHTTRR